MSTPTNNSVKFVEMVNARFREDDANCVLSVIPGRKYDKIVRSTDFTRSVFAFVNRETGELLKAASWNHPAKGVRYNGNELLTMAVEDADPYGEFLYLR